MARCILRSFIRFPSGCICSLAKPASAYSRWHGYSNHHDYVNFCFGQKANNSRLSNGVKSRGTSRNYSSSVTSKCEIIDGREYLAMTDDKLMSQCEMDTFKVSGPGGQHRNKRESAVRLKHLQTGITAQASEDRSQHKNRAAALSRLRKLLALKEGMQALLDLLFAVGGSVSEAAKKIGLSTGALSRLILSDDSLRQAVNEFRVEKWSEASQALHKIHAAKYLQHSDLAESI
ncbi:hypothetical protein OROHE_019674 [Orobanche hederae]